jgi:hypothetical protein
MRKVLLYFILLMAIVLAGTVAYVSISGLLTVFSGAGILGLLFFSSIEISKIVATSAIHTYGKKIGLTYNILLSLGIIIAMGITSMGVYGFLSSGYQKNTTKLNSSNREITLITDKIKLKEKNRESINQQLLQTQKSISDLRNALGNNTQTRLDNKGNIITTSSAANRKSYENQLNIATQSEIKLSNDLSSTDSLINVLYDTKIKLESEADTSNELGPLKYLAEVTGTSMDNVMKWFILLLIIIGDPMAILMIIIFNKIINQNEGEVSEITNNTPNNYVYLDNSEYITEGVNISENEYLNQEPEEVNTLKTTIKPNDYVEPNGDSIETIKKNDKKITLEDLPEKNRGFSVNIPDRKSNNSVKRLG